MQSRKLLSLMSRTANLHQAQHQVPVATNAWRVQPRQRAQQSILPVPAVTIGFARHSHQMLRMRLQCQDCLQQSLAGNVAMQVGESLPSRHWPRQKLASPSSTQAPAGHTDRSPIESAQGPFLARNRAQTHDHIVATVRTRESRLNSFPTMSPKSPKTNPVATHSEC